jgi:pimeloyl-ACP methyl ester carboxylesterase
MAEELTKAMGGNARLVSLPGVGHNNMLDSGERLWRAVEDFLSPSSRD